MYGLSGQRRLIERELPWLPGYEDSRPVRIGNAAFDQRQLDVYGQVMDAHYVARCHGLDADAPAWRVQRALLDFLESGWAEPDEGIWEVRGPRRHFTHSKMMTWVAFDRAVKMAEQFRADGPIDRWRALRDHIHAEVCARGYDARRNTFTQFYGSRELDASLLLMPLVGFLPADDARVRGTVAAVERELMVDGFVSRYRTSPTGEVDGLPDREGAFLPCTFWLADNYARQGRRAEAHIVCERLLAIANDVGLFAEQYDPQARRQLGNFPQAFSHVALINTARNLVGTPQVSGERR
jgi:GH15 family glucan-1,4-alpha-glucosidase